MNVQLMIIRTTKSGLFGSSNKLHENKENNAFITSTVYAPACYTKGRNTERRKVVIVAVLTGKHTHEV
jgi:hypothetical protein